MITPHLSTFDTAQKRCKSLLAHGPYARFLEWDVYRKLAYPDNPDGGPDHPAADEAYTKGNGNPPLQQPSPQAIHPATPFIVAPPPGARNSAAGTPTPPSRPPGNVVTTKVVLEVPPSSLPSGRTTPPRRLDVVRSPAALEFPSGSSPSPSQKSTPSRLKPPSNSPSN